MDADGLDSESGTGEPRPQRLAELSANLAEVRVRIGEAATRSGRAPDDVALVVVTKAWPASDVRALATLGVIDVAENRVQELADKRPAVPAVGLRWHLVGGLQTNKAYKAAMLADVVESIDRDKLVLALNEGGARAERGIECLVQINLDPVARPGRSGVAPGDASRLADMVAGQEWLRLRGVMGVAPLRADPAPAFATLAEVAEGIVSAHPAADVISAGMSLDFSAAIEAGATQVRIGTAVLGNRPGLR